MKLTETDKKRLLDISNGLFLNMARLKHYKKNGGATPVFKTLKSKGSAACQK